MDLAQYELLTRICQRPGMYVGTADVPKVCAYISGLDQATGCLTGFREWFVTRFEDGDNMTWVALVMFHPEQENLQGELAIGRLGQLISKFYEFMGETGDTSMGLTRVYLRYHAWLLRKPWYRPGWPRYIAPYDGEDIQRRPLEDLENSA